MVGKRPSFAWRSIIFGREFLEKGLRKMVGNGEFLGVWTDPWLFDGRMRIPFMKNILVDLNFRVNDLIDVQRRDWNLDMLNDLFYPADVACITEKKPVVSKDDFWCWIHNKSGDYTESS